MMMLDEQALMDMYNIQDKEQIALLKKANMFNSKHKNEELINDITYETALLLAIDFHADINTIVASLIYRNAANYNDKQIKEMFNEEIMYKVKLLKIFNRDILSSELEDRKNMINSILSDVKVTIIKLVERVAIFHNINMENIPKYRNFLIDTLNFYVPVAQLLGIYKIKNNLEDLCYRYDDNYETSNLILQKVMDKYDSFMPYLENQFVKMNLEFKNDISFKTNRKSNYDIHTKVNKVKEKIEMLQNDNDINISGFCSVKCLTKTKQECYSMLYFLHQFKHLLGSFCDYISGFQGDEYRAIHTKVFINNYLVDFRICTDEMDFVNYYGITSNWYKDNNLQARLMNNYAFYHELEDLVGKNQDIVPAFQKEIIDTKLDLNKCMSIQKIKKI